MLNIQNYGSSSEDEGENNAEEAKQHSNELLLTHLKAVDPELSIAKKMQICAAPVVMPTVRFKIWCSNLYNLEIFAFFCLKIQWRRLYFYCNSLSDTTVHVN